MHPQARAPKHPSLMYFFFHRLKISRNSSSNNSNNSSSLKNHVFRWWRDLLSSSSPSSLCIETACLAFLHSVRSVSCAGAVGPVAIRIIRTEGVALKLGESHSPPLHSSAGVFEISTQNTKGPFETAQKIFFATRTAVTFCSYTRQVRNDGPTYVFRVIV